MDVVRMLPMWVLALPIWLVVFIVLYALATLYVAIKYREVRKFLAGAFFVSSGTCWYLWMTGVSFPIVLPYAGTVSVETLRSAANGPSYISFYSCCASISVSSENRSKSFRTKGRFWHNSDLRRCPLSRRYQGHSGHQGTTIYEYAA